MELTGYLHDKELTMRKVLFLPAQGRLITLSINMGGPGASGNVLHFWEIDDSKVEKVTTFGHPIYSSSIILAGYTYYFRLKPLFWTLLTQR